MAGKDLGQLVHEARLTLNLHTDVDFAKFLGVSRRTVQRHRSAAGFPGTETRAKFVRALFPRDPATARALASTYRVDLSDLEARAAQPPVVRAPTIGREHVAMLILTASDALNMLPRDVRPLLATIFGEAIALGVDLNELAPLLAPRKPPAGNKGTPV